MQWQHFSCGGRIFCAAAVLSKTYMYFIFTVDPGPLPIQFMHKEYLLSQIDKLAELNPEYSEVQLLDTTPVQSKGDQPGTSGEPPKKKARSTRSASKEPVEVAGSPVKEGVQPEAVEKLRGMGEAQALAYNLTDLKEVVELSDYLSLNGGWELFTTPKNGQCCFSSFLKGIDVPEEYRASHLRYQLGPWCVQNHEFAFNRLKMLILAEYGHARITREEYLRRIDSQEDPLTDEQVEDYQKPGPFSFITYLKYLMQDSSWGDEGIITLIGMMWQCSITIIQVGKKAPKHDQPHKFLQLKIRHSKPLDDVDIALVYAGHSHYLGTCKYTPFLVLLLIPCDCVATALSVWQQGFWCSGRLGGVGIVWAVRVSNLGDSQCSIFVVRRQSIGCGYSVPCVGVGFSVRR